MTKRNQRQRKKANQKFVIIRDTKEQCGYLFNTINPQPAIIDRHLETGDYSIEGLENEITIERKSLIDAYRTFGKERRRFEAELRRMTEFKFAAVVIEADWVSIIRFPPVWSQMRPKAFFASIVAWSQRYNVHFFTCPNRAFAEKLTYRMLERYHNDKIKKLKQNRTKK